MKQETIMIDNVKYVREDSISKTNILAENVDGLEYAIVRSRNHGVLAGYIESFEGQTVKLKNCRRIWKFVGCETLEEMSVYGTKKINQCRIAPLVQKEVMLEACGIIYCTEEAKKCIEEAEEWKQ